MELLVIAAIALLIALVVRRKDALALRWQPTRHTWVAIGTGLLACLFSCLMLLCRPESIADRLIHHGSIYWLCGFAIPWGYVLLVEKSSPASMGLQRHRWPISLVISALMAGLFIPIILTEANPAALGWDNLARAAFILTGAGGLFELFLYYGFIHLRVERAFGTIPAILIASALYTTWHVGTQLPLEADPVAALGKLFLVGLMYQSIFCLTRNLLIIWPLFHLAGVMLDFVVNIGSLEETLRSFPWAVGTVAAMAVTGAVLAWWSRRRGTDPAAGQPADMEGGRAAVAK
jgi:hypothetical protein